MKRNRGILALLFVASGLAIAFQNCSSENFSQANQGTQSKDAAVGALPPDPSIGSTGTPSPDQPIHPPTLQTGHPDIDNTIDPVLTAISHADPDFDPRSIYYVNFGLVKNLVHLLFQKSYEPSPETCTSSLSWGVGPLNFNDHKNLAVSVCDGFKRALTVKAAQGGRCTAKVAESRKFSFAPVIDFDRTTELDQDCLCLRRYKLNLFNNATLISHEVRIFVPTEKCALDFPEYRQ